MWGINLPRPPPMRIQLFCHSFHISLVAWLVPRKISPDTPTRTVKWGKLSYVYEISTFETLISTIANHD